MGDTAERFFVVLSGWIKLYRETGEGEEAVVALFKRGDVFGEAAVFNGAGYPFSAEASEDSRVLEIPASVLRECARRNHEIMDRVMASMSQELRNLRLLSIGCNIELPFEQNPNPYTDVTLRFHHFFVRKVMLLKYSTAFILMPGGFGTMDEVFEVATLIQTRKVCNFPVVIMGSDYWKEIGPFIRKTMIAAGTISESDLDFIKITDDPIEAVKLIQNPYKCS